MPPHKHLKRLAHIWVEKPVYFITCCTEKRFPCLARQESARILLQGWQDAEPVSGWSVGHYVIMPDHVHFFCINQRGLKDLSSFIRDWKRFTSRRILVLLKREPPLWQREFYDHILRSEESYATRLSYVWQNPVRKGLVKKREDWPYLGEIGNLF